MSDEEVIIHVRTIPVPVGWSVEQAWEAISRKDPLPTPPGSWANIATKAGKLYSVIRHHSV